MVKTYWQLAKPGIIYGNALTAAAGFFLASQGHPDWHLGAIVLVGLSLIVASGCVFNNYLDRESDARMARTQGRALVTGLVSPRAALLYATCLGIVGALILFFGTNLLATGVALLGLFVYVVLYSAVAKPRSPYAVHIGSVAGAVPPVVGYLSVVGHFGWGVFILFLILVCWQMPHFFAIALYRMDEYAAAGVPVWPLRRGVRSTKVNLALWSGAFTLVAVSLSLFGYAGRVYGAVAVVLGLAWCGIALWGLWASDTKRFARKVFFFSLVVILLLCLAMSLDGRCSILNTCATADTPTI